MSGINHKTPETNPKTSGTNSEINNSKTDKPDNTPEITSLHGLYEEKIIKDFLPERIIRIVKAAEYRVKTALEGPNPRLTEHQRNELGRYTQIGRNLFVQHALDQVLRIRKVNGDLVKTGITGIEIKRVQLKGEHEYDLLIVKRKNGKIAVYGRNRKTNEVNQLGEDYDKYEINKDNYTLIGYNTEKSGKSEETKEGGKTTKTEETEKTIYVLPEYSKETKKTIKVGNGKFNIFIGPKRTVIANEEGRTCVIKGKVKFLKMGSGTSFVKKNGEVKSSGEKSNNNSVNGILLEVKQANNDYGYRDKHYYLFLDEFFNQTDAGKIKKEGGNIIGYRTKITKRFTFEPGEFVQTDSKGTGQNQSESTPIN